MQDSKVMSKKRIYDKYAEVILEQSIKELTTCQICKNIFTDPRALPCLHTFCNECIKSNIKWWKFISCPICNEKIIIGAESLGNCSLCENACLGLCPHCDGALCESCFEKHKIILERIVEKKLEEIVRKISKLEAIIKPVEKTIYVNPISAKEDIEKDCKIILTFMNKYKDEFVQKIELYRQNESRMKDLLELLMLTRKFDEQLMSLLKDKMVLLTKS